MNLLGCLQKTMAVAVIDGQHRPDKDFDAMKEPAASRLHRIGCLCVAALTALSVVSPLRAQDAGALFSPGPAMNIARMGHHIAPLPGGKAIVFGGHIPGFYPTNTAEIFDPGTNTWTSMNMNYLHDNSAFVKLNDGRYLLAGGLAGWGGTGQTNTAEIYDPATNTFTPTAGLMSTPRATCTGATLASGKVLVVGNWYADASYAEVFDPATGLFTPTGGLNSPRSNAQVIATSDGGAVVYGGLGPYGWPWFDQVEYYDPNTNSFSVLQENLFGDGQSYYVYQDIPVDPGSRRMSNGRYIFKTWDSSSNLVIYTFDPQTKQFAKLNTTPPVPPPGSGWIHSLVVDLARSKVYALSYDMTGTSVRLHTLNPDTGELSMPPDFYSLGRSIYGADASTVLSDGNLLWCGGTSYDNFSAQNATLLATPTGGPATVNDTKEELLGDMMDLRDTMTDKHDGRKLEEAIDHLEKSLDPALWSDDGNHLAARHGDKVFNEEKEAANKLGDLLKKSSIPDSTLQDFIDVIVAADRELAQIAVSEASDSKNIGKAEEELAKGDAENTRGRFTNAIEHYRNAWKHAQKADG